MNKTAPYVQQDPSTSSSYNKPTEYPPYRDEEDVDNAPDYGIKSEDVQVSYARNFGLDDIPHVRCYRKGSEFLTLIFQVRAAMVA